MNEELIRQIIRESLILEASKNAITQKIADQSSGVYKPGNTSRGAPHIRLTVNAGGDPDAHTKAKGYKEEEHKSILRKAGFEVEGVIPRSGKAPGNDEKFSSQFPAYKITDPDDGSEHYVVFAGGEKTKKEQISIDSISGQIKNMSAEEKKEHVLISPDPDSDLPELRRPRFVKGIQKVGGTPKADAVMSGLTQEDNIYFSLKAGSRPIDHQQWSGATDFNNHPTVREFVTNIVGISETSESDVSLPKDGKYAMAFHKELGNSPAEEDLKVFAVYGPEAVPIVETGFSTEKVHIVVQADLPQVTQIASEAESSLRSEFSVPADQKIYTVEGAHKVSYPNIPAGEYAPHLHARFDSTSGLKVGQFLDSDFVSKTGLDTGISQKGVRFLIFPKGKLPKKSQDINRFRASAFGTVEESLIREFIREALLTEAFTKTDERAIETMARKQIDKKWKDHEKKIDKMFDDRDKTLFRNDAFYKVIARIYQELQRAYAEDQFKYAARYTRKDIPLARFRPS